MTDCPHRSIESRRARWLRCPLPLRPPPLRHQEFGDLQAISEESQIARLHQELKPYLLRRMKKDVEKSLPPKVEQYVGSCATRAVPLPALNRSSQRRPGRARSTVAHANARILRVQLTPRQEELYKLIVEKNYLALRKTNSSVRPWRPWTPAGPRERWTSES